MRKQNYLASAECHEIGDRPLGNMSGSLEKKILFLRQSQRPSGMFFPGTQGSVSHIFWLSWQKYRALGDQSDGDYKRFNRQKIGERGRGASFAALNIKISVLLTSWSLASLCCEVGTEFGLELERLMAPEPMRLWPLSASWPGSMSPERPPLASPRSLSESVSAMLSVSSWKNGKVKNKLSQQLMHCPL